MANIDYANSLKTVGQFPLDGKTNFLTKNDLINLGTNNVNAFTYYEDMQVKCIEDHNTYIWRERTVDDEIDDGELTTDFTYPNGSVSNGITYSNRNFNFFLVKDKSKTSELINDGENGLNPFITLLDIPIVITPNLQGVTNEGNNTTNNILLNGSELQLGNSLNKIYEESDNIKINSNKGVDLIVGSSNLSLTGTVLSYVNNDSYLQYSISGLNNQISSVSNGGSIANLNFGNGASWVLPDNKSGTIALIDDIPNYVAGWENENQLGNVVTIGKGLGKLRLTNGSNAIVGIDGVDFTNSSDFNSPAYQFEATIIMPDGTYRYIEFSSFTNSTNAVIGSLYEDQGYGTSLGANWDLATGDYEYFPIFIGKSSADAAFSSGYNSIASGFSSFCSSDNVASGSRSASFGSGNTASGSNSFSIGRNNTASGTSSSCFGQDNTATGTQSVAFGQDNTSSNFRSYAVGENNVASGINTFVTGFNNFARAANESTFGAFSTDYTPTNTITDRIFNFGNGTSLANRHDAFTGLKNGELGIGIDNFESNTTGEKLQVNGLIKSDVLISSITDNKHVITKEYLDNITSTLATNTKGSFTPTFVTNGSSFNPSSIFSSEYYRIGDRLFVDIRLSNVTSDGTSSTGAILIQLSSLLGSNTCDAHAAGSMYFEDTNLNSNCFIGFSDTTIEFRDLVLTSEDITISINFTLSDSNPI